MFEEALNTKSSSEDRFNDVFSKTTRKGGSHGLLQTFLSRNCLDVSRIFFHFASSKTDLGLQGTELKYELCCS